MQMKRFLLYAVTVLVICLCGCAKETVYTTKYVDNCVSTEFRQGPSNASTVLRDLKFGEIVSYEKDEKNGYSKVVYNGVTGYVLSAMLSEKKPAENITSIPEDNTVITNTSKNKYDYLISNFGAEYIEKHISTYIRPLYYKINDNMNLYSKNSSGSAISWYDNGRLCKKEFPQGAENYNMSRQYYYDADSGEMVFAFVFNGTQEYRLYFKNGKLIRYIDANGNIINNPTTTESLLMAAHVINEAY